MFYNLLINVFEKSGFTNNEVNFRKNTYNNYSSSLYCYVDNFIFNSDIIILIMV